MITDKRVGAQDRRGTASHSDAVELASFTQNLATLEKIVAKMEAEASTDEPNIDRLTIYQSEILSMLDELIAQKTNAVALHGEGDPDVQRLGHLIHVRFAAVSERVKEIMVQTLQGLRHLQDHMATLESTPADGLPVDNPALPREDVSMTDLTRQEVDAKLAANRAEVDARLANFDTSVKTGFAELKVEIQKMRGDIEKQSHDSTKWIIGSVFGMVSLAVAIIGVMINLNKAEKSPAPQPAPIIITVPGATSAPVQAPAAK